jgi:hypothetical protein
MTLLVAIAAALISVFGLLTLIGDWAEKAGTPQRWVRLDPKRRSFIILGISVALGAVVGGGTRYLAWTKSRVLYLLFDLEVILAQLEGLTNVAIAQQDVVRTLEPIRILVQQLGEYGFKAARLMARLQRLLPAEEYKELKYGAMAITVGLEELDVPDPSALDSHAVNAGLINMQGGIRRARAATRKLIYERTSA